MKKILVMGGGGFIGSALCKKLLADNCSVIALTRSFSKQRNVKEILNHPNFTLVQHDVRTPFDYEVEEIYNLASPASPKDVALDPVGTLTTNILGTINALDLAHRTGARLLLASTSEIYGYSSAAPQSESSYGNVDPVGGRSCYYESKRCAEALVFDAYRRLKTPVKIVRLFNTYGPCFDPHDGRVASNFITQAHQNRPITLHGQGNQLRSFCYIGDMVAALILMMGTPDDVTGPINLGSPAAITVRDFAELICRISGSRSEIISIGPTENAHNLYPDITAAKSTLNWAPQISLVDGLERTIAYFKRLDHELHGVVPVSVTSSHSA